ncbi:hypothetical protein QJS10_CPB04g01494 [Acorus calamus]|uniref:Reverse transcriptase zinc-binding domain-containing protein n=1 Tax=Acorus calamus TaxID=4465 RepID=A0AAV9F0W5_ACOCL|nr:hypothetical protein QJS10_CPB04g01494 [Acorus calamus]
MAKKISEIWLPKISLKVKKIMWLMYQEKLLTKAYQARWVFQANTTCQVCNGGVESASHIMVECPFAKQVWQHLVGMMEFRDGSSSLEELWGWGSA